MNTERSAPNHATPAPGSSLSSVIKEAPNACPLPAFLKKLVPLKEITRDLSGATALTVPSDVSDSETFDDPFAAMVDEDDWYPQESSSQDLYSLLAQDDALAPPLSAGSAAENNGEIQSEFLDILAELEEGGQENDEAPFIVDSLRFVKARRLVSPSEKSTSLESEFRRILDQLRDEEEKKGHANNSWRNYEENDFLKDSRRFVKVRRLAASAARADNEEKSGRLQRASKRQTAREAKSVRKHQICVLRN